MAAQALYLKYRPQTFDQVVGQQAVTRTLRNALRQGRVRHAYLFTGPRGTGKTTMARLLAKAVNCQAPEEERPCNTCSLCRAINDGRLLDLIEIDAASNRGIDEIRDIREKVGFRPNEGRYKVYVLDEAHMLTEPAFNALLKTLEEPPPHVIFILVTTDPHKIPATITSRCQRFDFRRIALPAIVDRLATIAEQEGVAVEPAALELIAQQGTGAMRDAVSLLDQLASYGDEVTLEQVQMVLGTVSGEAAGRLAACLAEGDVAGGLDVVNRAVSDGVDPRQFGRGVVEYLRGLLLIQQGASTQLLNATAEQAAEMEALAARMPAGRLVHAIRLFSDAVTEVRSGLQAIPQLPLEMALVEAIVLPAGQGVAASSAPQSEPTQPALRPAPTAGRQPGSAGGVGRVAEPAAPVLAETTPADIPPPPSPTAETGAAPEAPRGGLALAQVQGNWERVLQVVRQRNPTTQGVLNTGCKPAEVNGNEIVITFPFPFLREKLRDPQRLMEIQDALSEVFDANCTVKLVLADEFKPRRPGPAPSSPPATEGLRAKNVEVPSEIDRWASEHGAETRVLPS